MQLSFQFVDLILRNDHGYEDASTDVHPACFLSLARNLHIISMGVLSDAKYAKELYSPLGFVWGKCQIFRQKLFFWRRGDGRCGNSSPTFYVYISENRMKINGSVKGVDGRRGRKGACRGE